MLSITNRKIGGFDPRWAPLRGFSLLFDNPGDSFTRSGDRIDLTANLADPALVFYRRLHDFVAGLGKDHLLNNYLFCPLPPTCYHVTAWDGLDAGKLDRLSRGHRAGFQNFFAELPDSLGRASPLLETLRGSPLIRGPGLRFRFERLASESSSAVLAELAPADEESAVALEVLTTWRATWADAFQAAFGLGPSRSRPFKPHVTLGYFANHEKAAFLHPLQEEWNGTLTEVMCDCQLALTGVSLYGFTDMISFFKWAPGH